MAQYADQLYMYIDGVHHEIMSASVNDSFDKREAVPTMHESGRPQGTRQGVGEATVTVKLPVRAGQTPFRSIGADPAQPTTILFRQRVNGPPSITLFGAFYKSQTPSADVEGEQAIDLELGCLDLKYGV